MRATGSVRMADHHTPKTRQNFSDGLFFLSYRLTTASLSNVTEPDPPSFFAQLKIHYRYFILSPICYNRSSELEKEWFVSMDRKNSIILISSLLLLFSSVFYFYHDHNQKVLKRSIYPIMHEDIRAKGANLNNIKFFVEKSINDFGEFQFNEREEELFLALRPRSITYNVNSVPEAKDMNRFNSKWIEVFDVLHLKMINMETKEIEALIKEFEFLINLLNETSVEYSSNGRTTISIKSEEILVKLSQIDSMLNG
ncbi:hypothetical protein [Heliorestis convoluta]|uniref:Uncharacterized protein n=1 Tax=Heliorestis convoluta TaxID=356322 RepID=A0A5Q2N326_9FIRM|nr:hypothetical protein [Heliorestis convoluta]QGG47692.1 hypothetical protein FTV88_1592 [Heliorestis convoluta]